MVWHEFMGKRGPKPADLGLLNVWEFEFYKAFHLLRDGNTLPARKALPISGLTRLEATSFVEKLKRMSAADYWLTTNHLAVEFGQHVNLNRPPTSMDLWWAEAKRKEEISWLERLLKPPHIETELKGKKIWRALVRASTYADLRKACGRWARLPAVRRAGLTPFPEHVLANAAQFLAMKKNKRFPISDYGDDSRLQFLARGMAGVMADLSPMTGVERLRNMKHGPGGPLWVERQLNHLLPPNEQHCGCWRCGLKQGDELTKVMQTAYDNGLRLFMEIGARTKAPKDWSNRAVHAHLRRT